MPKCCSCVLGKNRLWILIRIQTYFNRNTPGVCAPSMKRGKEATETKTKRKGLRLAFVGAVKGLIDRVTTKTCYDVTIELQYGLTFLMFYLTQHELIILKFDIKVHRVIIFQQR